MSTTCSNLTGSNSVIKIREEGSFGEFSQVGFNKVPVNTFGVGFSQNELESPTIVSGRAPSKKSLGDISIEGDVEIPLDDKYSHYFLKGIFGSHETTPNGLKYDHKYTINNKCIPSFSFEKSFSGTNLNYLSRGIKFSSLSVSMSDEGQINATVSSMGKSEELRYVPVDSRSETLAQAAVLDDEIIEVSDGSVFETGDVITFAKPVASINGDYAAGQIELNVDIASGQSISQTELIEINGTPYAVRVSSGSKIVLNKPLEDAVSDLDVIKSVNESYKIASTSGNLLTLEKPLGFELEIGDVVYGEPLESTVAPGFFDKSQVTLTSSDGDIALALVQGLDFSYDNAIEGQRTINSKGSYGLLIEGRTAITCELSLLFATENARMLEDAKLGKVFDLDISLINSDGNSIKIHMGQGTLTPVGPSIEGTGVINLSATFSPYGDDISITLTNDIGTY